MNERMRLRNVGMVFSLSLSLSLRSVDLEALESADV